MSSSPIPVAEPDDDPQRKASAEAALAAYAQALASSNEAELTKFVEETAPALFEEYCPPYCSFQEWGGADGGWGIVPDTESLRCAIQDKDGVISVVAGDEWPELDESVYFCAEVNDHGNLTLYDAKTRTEVWSCV